MGGLQKIRELSVVVHGWRGDGEKNLRISVGGTIDRTCVCLTTERKEVIRGNQCLPEAAPAPCQKGNKGEEESLGSHTFQCHALAVISLGHCDIRQLKLGSGAQDWVQEMRDKRGEKKSYCQQQGLREEVAPWSWQPDLRGPPSPPWPSPARCLLLSPHCTRLIS